MRHWIAKMFHYKSLFIKTFPFIIIYHPFYKKNRQKYRYQCNNNYIYQSMSFQCRTVTGGETPPLQDYIFVISTNSTSLIVLPDSRTFTNDFAVSTAVRLQIERSMDFLLILTLSRSGSLPFAEVDIT